MAIGQLSGRRSLRDLVDNISAQQQKLYHLGSAKLSRSNLSRINESKPHELYQALFGVLLKRCQSAAPGHGFRFNNELFSMDASTIDLCLSVFPWASFRKAKAGIKLHVAMNHKGNLPEFVTITDARTHEVNEGRGVDFPKGSIVAVDRGYTDYKWYKNLSDKGIYFVARMFKWIKQNLKIKTFMGTSRNAVMTQIWIAMCVYLLIAYLKFISKAKRSMQQIVNLLQMNLFAKRSIHDLIHGRSTEKIPINPDQLAFADMLTGH